MGDRIRRHVLRLAGAGLVATIAGCGGPGEEGGEEEGGGKEGGEEEGGGGEEESNIKPAFNGADEA